MYTSTFTFAQGEYDAEFLALNRAIAQIARTIPGYLDEETWENAAAGLISNVYYWESMQALERFLNDPAHLQPQHTRARTLSGYQVVVAQVLGSYGQGRINHPLSGRAIPQA